MKPMRPEETLETRGVSKIMVTPDATFLEVAQRHMGARADGVPAGIALVVDDQGRLIGTITDGDLRRGILRKGALEGTAREIMRTDPIVFNQRMSFQDILRSLPGELRRRGRPEHRFLGKIVLVDDRIRPVRVLDYHHLWEQRIATHRHVSVIGLGYVGLTLALTLADKGHHVTGIDIDRKKVDALLRGELYLHEIGLPALFKEHLHKNFVPALAMPEYGDVFILAVGTPLSLDGAPNTPNLDHLRLACEMVGRQLGMGGLVILRSTVPIGTTNGFIKPMLERISGLQAGTDFHLAFAPERTVEGDALRELLELPQIIGGINEDSVEAASAVFREVNPSIVRVGSCEAAEMAKLINNCFRDLIFSFSNEMAQVAARFNIDIHQIIKASNTGYPRDPVPLPSPGVGGPCLTKDPYILAWVEQQGDFKPTLGEQGRAVNEAMTGFVAQRLLDQLDRLGKQPAKAKVLICGLAFKGHPETGDLRNSPALDLWRILEGQVDQVYGHDPVADETQIQAEGLLPVQLPEGFANMDAVVFMNNHASFRKLDAFEMVRSMASPAIVVDGWNLLNAADVLHAAPCVYMGLSHIESSVPSDGERG